jgi:glycosyltransferase involved in cell wall biosynthesis
MPASHPRITLVTPVFNGARFIEAAIRSIRAQNYPNLEYIVCDGNSTDDTLAHVSHHRDLVTKVIPGPDQGMYDALNKGYAAATGEIFGWLNADDMLMPWCLDCVAAYFAAHPECQWLTGIPAIFDAQGRLAWVANVAPQYRRKWIAKGWYSHIGLGVIQQECTFWRRGLFERVGGLDAGLKWGGDLDLWRRFAAHEELHQVGTLLAGFRQHDRNASATHSKLYHDEAGAKRLPGGRILGYSYSFMRFMFDRLKKRRRLTDILLGP